jgi:hypothetical protein
MLARNEALGVIAAVVGLTTFLALTRPTGPGRTLDATTAGAITLVILGLLATIWVVNRGAGSAQGVGLALAAGTAAATASMFTQAVLASGRWQSMVPVLVAMVAFSLLGMLFSQLSYRRSFSAPMATATVTNPVASAALGVLVLGEQTSSGAAATAVGLAAAMVAAGGIVLLARSGAVATAAS